MGNNYHLRLNKCSECGHYDELHIGKSSAGWRFLFRVGYPAEPGRIAINDVRDWRLLTRLGAIFNEYDIEITHEAFWKLIKNKQPEDSVNIWDHNGESAWVDEQGYNYANHDFS